VGKGGKEGRKKKGGEKGIVRQLLSISTTYTEKEKKKKKKEERTMPVLHSDLYDGYDVLRRRKKGKGERKGGTYVVVGHPLSSLHDLGSWRGKRRRKGGKKKGSPALSPPPPPPPPLPPAGRTRRKKKKERKGRAITCFFYSFPVPPSTFWFLTTV